MYKIFKFPSNFLEKNYDFILQNAELLREVNNILKLNYDVNDLLVNDIDALKSRLFFVNNSYLIDFSMSLF